MPLLRAGYPYDDGRLQNRRFSDSDHNVRRLDDYDSIGSDRQSEIIDSLVRDRRCNDVAFANIDSNVRCRRALKDGNDFALELVACADFHGILRVG
jgi:hypothetical protein